MTDVKNSIYKFKDRSLGEKAKTHLLFDELERNFRSKKAHSVFPHSIDSENPIQFFYRYILSAGGYLGHPFLAHPYSIGMLKEIWMFSCLTVPIKPVL